MHAYRLQAARLAQLQAMTREPQPSRESVILHHLSDRGITQQQRSAGQQTDLWNACVQVAHLLQLSQDLLGRGPPANSSASLWSGASDKLSACSRWAHRPDSAQPAPRLQGPAASPQSLLLAPPFGHAPREPAATTHVPHVHLDGHKLSSREAGLPRRPLRSRFSLKGAVIPRRLAEIMAAVTNSTVQPVGQETCKQVFAWRGGSLTCKPAVNSCMALAMEN